MPPSLSSFRAEVGRRGFDQAAEIYADIQKENHDFKLDVDAVMSWVYRLMADGHLPEASDVMKLAIRIDPSSGAYAGLPEAYMKSGPPELLRCSHEGNRNAPQLGAESMA
jgi:hypothetical protein